MRDVEMKHARADPPETLFKTIHGGSYPAPSRRPFEAFGTTRLDVLPHILCVVSVESLPVVQNRFALYCVIVRYIPSLSVVAFQKSTARSKTPLRLIHSKA